MKYLNYLIFRSTVFLFRLLPFPIIYGLSNILAWLFFKVVRYRYTVINENINRVYPNLTERQKHELIHKIYKNLADITLEGIKGISMSKRQIMNRHKLINPTFLDEAYNIGTSVILVTGHYNNWEWGAFSPSYYLNHTIVGLYKPLTNEKINQYVINKRSKGGCVLADINQTKYYFDKYHNEPSVFLMAADQSPTKPELAIWLDFLGVKTPCLHGLEKYVTEYDLPVVFCSIYRKARGFYELELSWIKAPNEEQFPYGKVTIDYMKKLESIIQEKPENWLWSHRRWKHVKDD